MGLTSHIVDLPPAYATLKDSKEDLREDPVVAVAHDDAEEKPEAMENHDFQNSDTRLAFTQKILCIRLLQSIGCLLYLTFIESNYRWIYYNPRLQQSNYIVLAVLLYLGVLGALVYFKFTGQTKTPYKYAFLVAYPLTALTPISFLLFSDFMAGLMIAVGYMCLVLTGLLFYSIFAFRTQIKFLMKWGVCMAGVVFLVTVVIMVIFTYRNVLYSLIPVSVAFLECVYMLYDIKYMCTSDYHYAITPNDYVEAALNLHVDYFYVIKRVVKLCCAKLECFFI